MTKLFWDLARSRRSPEGTARSCQAEGTTGIGEVAERRDSHLALRSFSRYKNAMPKKVLVASGNIGFIETMDCLPVSKLREGPEWMYEIKLDGYRLEVVGNAKEITLYSRRRNVLNDRFGFIATALEYLPSGTIIDGEVVGLGADGHADFDLLQKFRSAQEETKEVWAKRVATARFQSLSSTWGRATELWRQ